MSRSKKIPVEIEVDKLTNSIENSFTGELFNTVVSRLDKKTNFNIVEGEWVFDWKIELSKKENEVYQLTTENNPTIIHGLICLQDKRDHIFIKLVESSNFNKGRNKVYLGVAGNLFAWACKLAFERGYDGYVAFDSKTSLIEHYQNTLGARHFRGLRMYLDTQNAIILVNKYFNKQ
ncbi:MAG: hypothetical protein H6581_08175 [Bacteroidia bacterium]|nr:hypothetical protein [Bacteroidia bacterium]